MPLTKNELIKYLNPLEGQPLVENMVDPAVQVQPAGIDLSLQKIFRFVSSATVAFTQAETHLPEYEEVPFDEKGLALLVPGPYKLVVNEIVHLPPNLMGIAQPRSTMLRCGATVNTALWDPGYNGRSELLLVVHNPQGLQLAYQARVAQLCFYELSSSLGEGETYQGRYQGENVRAG
ncbi:MAG: deoxyuridine 5'-triphosphate nucleotidohydrolase [Chloroflexota bacterium]|nr:deoxyuridine 5'-triphosphate nucleotidohydrolase [Chloroflexota bacterium]